MPLSARRKLGQSTDASIDWVIGVITKATLYFDSDFVETKSCRFVVALLQAVVRCMELTPRDQLCCNRSEISCNTQGCSWKGTLTSTEWHIKGLKERCSARKPCLMSTKRVQMPTQSSWLMKNDATAGHASIGQGPRRYVYYLMSRPTGQHGRTPVVRFLGICWLLNPVKEVRDETLLPSKSYLNAKERNNARLKYDCSRFSHSRSTSSRWALAYLDGAATTKPKRSYS